MFADMFRMDGQVAVVTGAGNGLGRSFALGLAEFGATVVCADRNIAGAEETVGLIGQKRGKAEAAFCDVADAASVAALWGHVEKTYGRADILINNAGITSAAARTHEMAVEDWDRVIAVNLRGVFLNTKYALALMLKHKSGSIISIASVAALRGYYPGGPGLVSNYSASKAGVSGFTRQVAAEYARDGIRVNAIAPGWHGGTALGAERRAKATKEELEAFEKGISQRIPMGRRGTPDDLVGLCVYLASGASHYVTGQTFAHDGGWDAMVV